VFVCLSALRRNRCCAANHRAMNQCISEIAVMQTRSPLQLQIEEGVCVCVCADPMQEIAVMQTRSLVASDRRRCVCLCV
jgi:hypothetical protein